MIGIYKITNPNNRVYIGQSWNMGERFKKYKNPKYKSSQKFLINSFNKYGYNFHSIGVLKTFDEKVTQKELDDYEIYFISYFKNLGYSMLNIREGGSRGKHSEETKKQMSKNKKGKPSPLKGVLKSEEHRKNISISKIGVKRKEGISEKIANTRRKRGQTIKEKEALNKKRVIATKKLEKAIYQMEKGVVINTFFSISEASRVTKILRTAISNCLNNWTNYAGGYTWKYV